MKNSLLWWFITFAGLTVLFTFVELGSAADEPVRWINNAFLLSLISYVFFTCALLQLGLLLLKHKTRKRSMRLAFYVSLGLAIFNLAHFVFFDSMDGLSNLMGTALGMLLILTLIRTLYPLQQQQQPT